MATIAAISSTSSFSWSGSMAEKFELEFEQSSSAPKRGIPLGTLAAREAAKSFWTFEMFQQSLQKIVEYSLPQASQPMAATCTSGYFSETSENDTQEDPEPVVQFHMDDSASERESQSASESADDTSTTAHAQVQLKSSSASSSSASTSSSSAPELVRNRQPRRDQFISRSAPVLGIRCTCVEDHGFYEQCS